MNKFSTLVALSACVFSVASHAGDITPESLELMAAPWRPAAAVKVAAQPATPLSAQLTRPGPDEAYDYDPPAGGWHVPGTRPGAAVIATASR